MNSLSVLANIATPPSSPLSRTTSSSNIAEPRSDGPVHSDDESTGIAIQSEQGKMDSGNDQRSAYTVTEAVATQYGEKTPLLSRPTKESSSGPTSQKRRLYLEHMSQGIVAVVSVLAAPFVYTRQCFVACFYYDQDGRFSLLAPVYHIAQTFRERRKRVSAHAPHPESSSHGTEKAGRHHYHRSGLSQAPMIKSSRRSSITSTSTAAVSDSDSERPPTRDKDMDNPAWNTRSKSSTSSSAGDEISPAKRLIRIKLRNEEPLRQRKAVRKSQASRDNSISPEAAAMLKSPTGSLALASKRLTKFPHAPEPPRPLVPRRQPSSPRLNSSGLGPHQKTLIIDLDETLIHSMAKGGRFQTGHMVEVKLQASVGAGGQIIGPQVPILYYVHKRPYCDDFLKKVSKWYNLIIFTASVQEYADPVIDWLEVERKYFVGRYYRQHCTLRNGAYIKDLAQVEPDLSKVMILDNSPVSYVFHPDNAIPIEGWISDPTDSDLLHIIPLLEGLQHVTDVRALLALRLGMPAPT